MKNIEPPAVHFPQKYLRQKVADAVQDLHLPVTPSPKVYDYLAAELAVKAEKAVATTVAEGVSAKTFFRAVEALSGQSEQAANG